MAILTGLSLPVGVDPVTGGAALSDSNASLRNLITLSLLEGDSDNPFQEALFEGSVFANNDISLRNFAVAQVERIMEQFKLEGIAELSPNGVKLYTFDGLVAPPEPIVEGEILLEIKYINLQNQQPDTVLVTGTN